MTEELKSLYARVERLERVYLTEDELPGEISLDGHASVRDLIRFVAFHTGQPSRVIVGSTRHQAAFRARAAVCWASMRLLGKSSTVTGRVLDDRDHTSVLAAVKRAETFIASDPAFRMLCRRIKVALAKGTLQ